MPQLRKTGEAEVVWADAFLATAPYFKLYTSYCRNYMRALETTRKCRQRDDFASFLASARARHESRGMMLEDFLIKPVQVRRARARNHLRDAPCAVSLRLQRRHVPVCIFHFVIATRPLSQRLLKYPLFFDSFLKEVPRDSPHTDRLQRAHELVRGVSSAVNESQTDGSETMQALLVSLGTPYLQVGALSRPPPSMTLHDLH